MLTPLSTTITVGQAYRCRARVVSVINWRGALGVNRYRIVVALLVLALLASASLSPADLSAQQQDPPIRLKAATFAPMRGEAPAIPPGLTLRGYAEGQRGYYLVQFPGPVEQAWLDELAAAGAEILAYVPEFAFKVRMTPAEARQVERNSSAGWVGLFHPAYKLSLSLVRDGTRLYTVRVERGADAGQAAAAIARSGATIVGREE